MSLGNRFRKTKILNLPLWSLAILLLPGGEIAAEVGYSRDAITQFVKSFNFVTNGTDSVCHKVAEIPAVAFDMWLALHTQAEIAEAIGYSQQAIADFIRDSGLTGNGGSAVSGETPDSDGDDLKGLRIRLPRLRNFGDVRP
jgi:hypothetical protein